jgi:GNAT superfamily N-acetyltransferase
MVEYFPFPIAPQLRLRLASNQDAAAAQAVVFAVLREYGLVPDPAETDADLQDLAAHYFARGGQFYVLTTASAEVVATLGLYYLDAQTVELRKMYLSSQLRGQGIGRGLLEFALAQARQMGFKRMTLETASVLKEAIGLYRRLGFQPLVGHQQVPRCDQAFYLDL